MEGMWFDVSILQALLGEKDWVFNVCKVQRFLGKVAQMFNLTHFKLILYRVYRWRKAGV